MFELVRDVNFRIDQGEVSAEKAAEVRDLFEQWDRVLGILALRQIEEGRPPVPVEEIARLIDARRAARLVRNFPEADRIRHDLDARGIILEDSGSTTRWKRK